MYYITLYVTAGQESAIESLYKEKGWTYLKTVTPIKSSVSPVVLPNGFGILSSQDKKPTLLNKQDKLLSTVTSRDTGQVCPSKSVKTMNEDKADVKTEIEPIADNLVNTSTSSQVCQTDFMESNDEDEQDEGTDTESSPMEENAHKTIIVKTEDVSQDENFGISTQQNYQYYITTGESVGLFKPNEDIFECDICHLRYIEEDYQKDHALLNCHKIMEEAKTEYGYKCLKCEDIFIASDNYIWHFLNKTCDTKACSYCGIDSSNREVYEKHQNTTCCRILYQTEKYQGKHVCYGCKTMYSTEFLKFYVRHNLLAVCSGSTLYCDFCGKTFIPRRRTNYRMHLQTHLNDRPHVCEECGKSYIDRGSLRIHMRKHTGEKPYKCRYADCDLYFPTGAHRNGHEMSKHTEQQKSQQCHLCGRGFKSKSSLNFHVNVAHLEERNFKCTTCYKRFKTDKLLQSHMNSHKTLRDHVCEVCGKGFKSVIHLKAHMMRHTDDKKHTCETCGKAFYTRQYLIQHERIHSGDKPYLCELCDYRCAVKGNLHKHIRCIHGKDNPKMFVVKAGK